MSRVSGGVEVCAVPYLADHDGTLDGVDLGRVALEHNSSFQRRFSVSSLAFTFSLNVSLLR